MNEAIMPFDPKMADPAFPTFIPEDQITYFGLSVRDYFAATALQAIGHRVPIDTPYWSDRVAQMAYELADAMLAQRGGPK